MALPGDVTTFSLTFGHSTNGYTDSTGAIALVGAKVKLWPVDLVTGKRLVVTHVATGQVIVPVDVTVTIDAEGKATVGPLPHTDNPTLSPVGFGYDSEWQVTSGSRRVAPRNKRFAVPTAAGATVDFDLLDVAAAVPGVLVPMGVSAGVADVAVSALLPGPSLTQAAMDGRYVRDTELDAQTAALVPGTGPTAVALRAAVVPKWKPNTAYVSGEPVVNPSGQLVTANTSFTSGASYVAGNWTITAGGGSQVKVDGANVATLDVSSAAVTAADVGAVPVALIDAKGDLIVGTAADTAARLAAGTNGQILTADSTVTAGVKWADAPAGGGSGVLPAGPQLQGFNAFSFDVVAASGTTVMANGKMAAARCVCTKAGTITNLYVATTAAAVGPTATAGQTPAAAIYNSAGTRLGITGDIGSILTGAAGLKTLPLTAGVTVTAGQEIYVSLFWSGTTGPTVARASNAFTLTGAGVGSAAANQRWAEFSGLTAPPATIDPLALPASGGSWWLAAA